MIDKNVYIYVLLLEEDKYYVGKTTNIKNRIDDHFTQFASSWTTKYKPVKIIEKIENCDNYDEDKYVKNIWIYMA
jgi:predicted GIY-YIG superfamily endonuclease